MHAATTLNALRKARWTWTHRTDPHVIEIRWVLRGFDEAMGIVRAHSHAEQAASRSPKLPANMAPALGHCILSALNHLRRAERGRAIAVLQKAVEIIEKRDLNK